MEQRAVDVNVRKLFWLCWLAYCVSYIGRLNYSACMSAIMPELGMSKTFAGAVSTGFLASYGTGQLINGLLGDRVSPKKMIGIGLLGVGLMNTAMGLMTSPYPMLVIWCFNGFFNSMLWSPIIHCFSEWMPADKQEKNGVRLSATIPAGTIISYLISSLLLKTSGWRPVFFVCGAILIIYSVVWLVGISSIREYITYIINKRREAGERAAREAAQSGGDDNILAGRSLLSLIFATGLVFTVIGILFNGILKDGVTQWVPTYVSDFFSVEPSAAAAITMVLPIVNLVGAFAAQRVNSRFFRNEMTTSAVFFCVSIAALTALFFFGKYNMVLAVFFIALSTSSMLGVNSMFLTYIPFRFGGVGRSASVTGFLNACSYIASALSSVTIGVVAENCGWSVTVLAWLGVAVGGAAVCFVGKSFWAKGRKRLGAF